MEVRAGGISRGAGNSKHVALLYLRCVAAGKKLRKRGVTQVVLPEEFPFRELLVKCGLEGRWNFPWSR